MSDYHLLHIDTTSNHMLGKRDERYESQPTHRSPMPRHPHPPANLNPPPLVATKFRFRDHYIKNLSYQPIDLSDLPMRTCENQPLELPGRGSLSRMSFWASRRVSKDGEVAFFKCTLPENNPVPVTKELLKNALEGLVRNQRNLKLMQQKQVYNPPEPRPKTAEMLERLNQEMTLEHQKMQALKPTPPPVQTVNAEVKLPSPSNRETLKSKRRMKSQAQYKFKDFEGIVNHVNDKIKGDPEKPTDERSMEHGTHSSQLHQGSHQHQHVHGSNAVVSLSDSSDQEDDGEEEEDEHESDEGELSRHQSTAPRNDQQAHQYQSQMRNRESHQSALGRDEGYPSQRANDRSMERMSNNQAKRRKQRTKWTKKKYAREVDVTQWKAKFTPAQAGRMVTRRHLQGLPVVVLKKTPRTKKPKPVLNLSLQDTRGGTLENIQPEKPQIITASEPKLAPTLNLEIFGPQVKNVGVMKSPKDSPAKLTLAEIIESKQQLEIQQFSNRQMAIRPIAPRPPQMKMGIFKGIGHQQLATVLDPPKSSIFDQESAKYLAIFKPREVLPPQAPQAPPPPAAAPEPIIPKVLPPTIAQGEIPTEMEEEPYVVPMQNLPICDPTLKICSVFDYNAQLSNFTGQNERNKLSYQESYQHYLAQIFRSGEPVCAMEYKFKGEVVHRYDQRVLQMIKTLFESNQTETDSLTKTVESIIKHTDTITNEHPSFEFPVGGGQQLGSKEMMGPGQHTYQVVYGQQSQANPVEQEIATKELELALNRNAFRYILIRFSLDIDLRLQDLVRLDQQELHMLVAFFNVKFGISDSQDRLFPNDSHETILKIANKYINKVLQRTQNFKKNEEFLKKKWKEFLKFVKVVFKDESGSGTAGGKGSFLCVTADSNKPQLNRLIYEKYHRQCVLKKMHEYNNDVARFRRFEWSVNEEIRWPTPDSETSEMNKLYSETEVQFMRVFFSVKA